MESFKGKIVEVELKDGSGSVRGVCVRDDDYHFEVIHPYLSVFDRHELKVVESHDQRPVVCDDLDLDIRATGCEEVSELTEYYWCIGGYAMQIKGITCGTIMASDDKKAEHLARTDAYKGYDKLFELFGDAVHADINGGLELYYDGNGDRIL